MEKIFLLLYFYDVLEKLQYILIFGGCSMLVLLFLYDGMVLDYCCKEKEEIEKIKKIKSNLMGYIKGIIVTVIIGILIAVLIPKKYLFYSYLGYNAGKELKIDKKISPILNKSLKIINLELDKKLNELKENK